MISKELLSEVLGGDVTQSTLIGDDRIKFRDRLSMQDSGCMINIYELGHKCKEWAKDLGYEIVEHCDIVRVYCNDSERYCHSISSPLIDYDVNRVFKACEWIKETR